MLDQTEGASAPFYLVGGIETHQRIAPDSLVETYHANVKRGLPNFWDLPEVGKFKGDGPIALAAGGPSLIETLHELHEMPVVMACGSAHDFIVSQGISPDFCVICDPDALAATFLTEPVDGCTYLVASHCHDDVFRALDGYNIYLWDSAGSVPDSVFDGRKVVCGGCSVTTRAINLAILLGWWNIHLFGFDSSYAEAGKEHAYQHGFGKREVMEVRVGRHGKTYLSTQEMVAQAQHFQEMLQNFGHCFVPTVHGDGMIAEMLKPHPMTEQEKYETIWNYPNYRNYAPGEHYVEKAIEAFGIRPFDRVFDFGCGTGRASQKFYDAEMIVTGFDFAGNCRDQEFPFNFEVHDLTKPIGKYCHFGFCTDVMEHIEPENVELVLSNIASVCAFGCYFVIFLEEDHFGSQIGESLHLTVRPATWWHEKLSALFPYVEMNDEGVRATFVCKSTLRAKGAK